MSGRVGFLLLQYNVGQKQDTTEEDVATPLRTTSSVALATTHYLPSTFPLQYVTTANELTLSAH